MGASFVLVYLVGMKTRRRSKDSDTLTAAGGSPPGMPIYAYWEAVVAFADTETGDGRWFGEFTWREGRHPFKKGHGHDAPVIGHVESYENRGGIIHGKGVYYDTPLGVEAANMAVSGGFKGVSVEPGQLSEVWFDDNPELEEPLVRFNEYQIGALSQVDIPGFDGAGLVTITLAEEGDEAEPLDAEDSDNEAAGDAVVAAGSDFGFGGLVASAALTTEYPSPSFGLPESPVPMPFTMFDDGSFAGHLAVKGTCHIGYADRCVTPPTSRLAYTPAKQGTLQLDNGTTIRVARMSIGSGHAPLKLNPRATADFYDNETQCAGFANVTDGDVGIWMAGHVNHDAHEATLRRFAKAAKSGDWRKIQRHLELVGILSVNIPGYPIPDARMWAREQNRALVASGAEPLDIDALVASGAKTVAEIDPTQGLQWAREVHGLAVWDDAERRAKANLIDRTAKSLGLKTTDEAKLARIEQARVKAGLG